MVLDKEKIIVIDARHAHQTMDGLGRYILELINGLSELIIPKMIILHTSTFPFKYLKKPEVFQFKLLDIPGSHPKQHIQVPLLLKKIKPDVYFYPFIDPPLFSPAKRNLFAVHDLNHFFFSKYAATERKSAILMAKFFIYSASFIYDEIFVFSEFVKSQLNHHVKASKNKTHVIYHGFSSFPVENKNPESMASDIRKPFILYVGNNRPHKNLERLFEAFKILSERNKEVSLVIVGNQIPRFFDVDKSIVQSNLQNRVIKISKASNQLLQNLYQECLFVIYPSLSEGFGLPLLEAWNFKVPIATSKATCLPEIAGDAAAFFDPYNTDDIAHVMDQLIKLPDWRQKIVDEGTKRLKNFTWKKSAQAHMKRFAN